MKVLVTGATGFLGSEIARELVRAGHAVRVLVRPTSRLDGLTGLPVEHAVGDVLDEGSIERALDGVDALIHAAAHVGARRRDREAVYRVNVEGTRTVLGAAARRAGLRVVVTSSIAAVGSSAEPRLLDEAAPFRSGGGYHYIDSKHQAEEVARAHAARGLDVVILNPGMILGPGDVYLTSTRLVLEYLRGRNRIHLGGGVSFCDVRDVARAHVAALTRGRPGERYVLAGQNHSYRDLQEELFRLTGLYRPVRVPYAAAWLLAVASEALAWVRPHGLEELNRPFLRQSVRYAWFDCAKAARELGYAPRPFTESLADTVRDHLARGLAPARASARARLAAGVA